LSNSDRWKRKGRFETYTDHKKKKKEEVKEVKFYIFQNSETMFNFVLLKNIVDVYHTILYQKDNAIALHV